jgi:hypothetical protein
MSLLGLAADAITLGAINVIDDRRPSLDTIGNALNSGQAPRFRADQATVIGVRD